MQCAARERGELLAQVAEHVVDRQEDALAELDHGRVL